jgi:hypothetical protein
VGVIGSIASGFLGDLAVESLVVRALESLVMVGGVLSPAMAILGLILWTSRLSKRTGRSLMICSVLFGVLFALLDVA